MKFPCETIILFLTLVLLHKYPVSCDDVQAQHLLSLLSPTPALGEPWPNIPGPGLDDRVCIVGAGAAGVHMAARLKNMKYENVSLLSLLVRLK